MEGDVETTSSQPHQREDRGAGGKLRRPPSRKPPATPYSRPPPPIPPPDEQRRWLSKLVVDPACRLISGGASLLFPSLFSKPQPPLLSDADDDDDADDDRDERENETDTCDADDEDQNCTINNEMSKATELEGPSRAANVTESNSDLVGQKKEIKGDMPDEKSLSDIELLLQGKKFSRDEVKHLMDIINSRSIEVPNKEQEKKNPTVTAEAEPKQPVASHDVIDLTSERKQRDLTGSLWKPKTPLPQSVMLDEVCASPIEIAKAYMGSRTIETGNFPKGSIQKDDRSLLFGSEFATKPFILSPSPKPSSYWPGSMVQDQRDYLTPQTHRGRSGLHNFSRTPYSRTIFSKSKSKLSQVQGDNDKWPRPPTSVQKLQTPIFGQGKSKSDALEDNHRSLGPICRSKHNPGAQTPFNGSSFIGSSLVGPLKVEYSEFSQGFLPAFKKNFEPGATSSSSQSRSVDRNNQSFELGTPTVHPHSSQIARTILEHIDRNPPTAKDKLEELKLAIAWNKSVSSSTPSLDPNGRNSLLNTKRSDSDTIVSLNGLKKSAEENAGKGKSLSVAPSQENIISDVNTWKNPSRSDVFLSNGSDGVQIKSSREVLNLQKPPTSVTKPVLSAISIDKPCLKWKLSSDQSSAFTFPISTASEVLSEPPTPSIMPSFSTSSQHQPKDGADVPTYTFGSTKSEPALVFSFPSSSNAGTEIDTSDIKFSFGSDKPRLSFSSIGKNAICY